MWAGLTLWGFVFTILCYLAGGVIPYRKETHLKRHGHTFMASGLNLFLLSMVLVVSANNALLFLVVWEVMSLISFFLVMYEYEHIETKDAGLLYLFMTHAGTAFIIILFLIFYSYSGSLSFNDFIRAGNMMPEWVRSIAFISALIGFGTKAGIVPLHAWLPKAHPVAPSHVSALMSGVMIKMGIYGLLRSIFYFLDRGALWWGAAILILGIIAAFAGVIAVVLSQDVKKLLAYSSVENIGIVFMGLGSTRGYGRPYKKDAMDIAVLPHRRPFHISAPAI